MDARLRELAEGPTRASSAEAAGILNAEFRTSFSRNACIGRAARLRPPVFFNSNSGKNHAGIKIRRFRSPGTQIKNFKPALANANVAKKIDRNLASGGLKGTPVELPQPTKIANFQPKNISFKDNEGCMWPTDFLEGEQFFCGHDKLTPRKPYCINHSKISLDQERMRKPRRGSGVYEPRKDIT